MKEIAFALAVVGAALTWAYYAPRIVATYRQMREQRLIQTASMVNPYERLNPGATRDDAAFRAIVRNIDATDPRWVGSVRRTSRLARNAGKWVALNTKRYRTGGYIKPIK